MLLQRRIHFFLGCLFVDENNQIYDRNVRSRTRIEKPSSLPAKSGRTSSQRFGCSRRGRNHVDHRRRARRRSLSEVENDLVVGIGMDRGHRSTDNLEVVVNDLAIGARQFVVQDALEIM